MSNPTDSSRSAMGEVAKSPAYERLRYVDASGALVRALPDFARERKALIDLYGAMVLTRTFDEKAVALQRTGRLGTFASSLGQEAVAVGVASAMHHDDVLLPSFREQGAQLWRGVTPTELLLYWGGDERGSDFAGPLEDFPVCIPIASHLPHAAGVALAFRLRGESRAAVCIAGDGATSKGDFYEALNVAGVWELPVVFIVNNNQWAISVPRHRQSAVPTLAQKSLAAGLPGMQVDGNDVIAVRAATQFAISRARDSGGATLIECLTYRLSDHTTADDATRYRSDEDVSARWHEEPVARLRSFLLAQKLWSMEDEEALIIECRQRLDHAVEEYESTAAQSAAAMFDYLYEKLPAEYSSQRTSAVGNGTNSSG